MLTQADKKEEWDFKACNALNRKDSTNKARDKKN